MKDSLVFVASEAASEVPFTTSEIIAEGTGIGRRKVRDAIRKYKEDLETFGRVASYQAPLETKGGVQTITGYILNEQQAAFLLTLLKNTPVVVAFKKELVRQFYAMRRELTQRAVAREAHKPTRREMTDAIRDCVPDSPHKAMMYPNYSKLAYQITLGRNVRQLREEKGAPPHGNLAEYLTAEETEAVKKTEGRISVLLEMGMDYQEIKAALVKSVSRIPACASTEQAQASA